MSFSDVYSSYCTHVILETFNLFTEILNPRGPAGILKTEARLLKTESLKTGISETGILQTGILGTVILETVI